MALERRHSISQLDEEFSCSVEEIIRDCPRFRILAIGKSGAGKSSLINAAFDVDDAHVSHSKAGKSDIHQEITSEKNPRFVLHDSQGFAAGETNNFETVENFIRTKALKEDVRDRLHAIWFCVEVPTENGPLFEVGDQRFLELPLGDVPVIVIFTKYDLLVAKLEKEATLTEDDEEDEAAFERRIEEQAEEMFQQMCVEPLRKITRGRSIPYMKISTKANYSNTLVDLVQVTQDHIDGAVWLIWAFAQRTNADMKIAASIQVGKSKYWRGLASSLHFPGQTLKKCLRAIHQDIVKVWNFYDPSLFLESTEFQALISHLVSDLIEENGDNQVTKVISVSGVVGVISAVAPPASLVAIPIAASLVFAQWVYLVYKATPGVLRGLMGYIIDLTIVMQSLFWLVQARNGSSKSKALPLDPGLIKLAIRAYRESGDRTVVHQGIKTYVETNGILAVYHKDRALEKIVELIKENRFQPPEEYKKHLRSSSVVLDRGWTDEPDELI